MKSLFLEIPFYQAVELLTSSLKKEGVAIHYIAKDQGIIKGSIQGKTLNIAQLVDVEIIPDKKNKCHANLCVNINDSPIYGNTKTKETREEEKKINLACAQVEEKLFNTIKNNTTEITLSKHVAFCNISNKR